jgi:parallel beta-helix repeat protein
MTAISITPGYPTFADTDGSPLNDGYVYIGLEYQDPITAPTTAFWDKEFRIPADQPLRTSGGYVVRDGSPAAVYTGAAYSILVQNKNLVTVYNAPSAVITNVTNDVEIITQYQGAHATDPVARNDGTPLQTGDLYFNTVVNELKVWTGTVWVPAVPGTVTVENFTGTGAQTAFNLATAPVAENNTQIYIDGVYQQKDTYTLSGATINFSTAPPYLSGIEVVTFSIASLGTVDASNVSYNEGDVGAVNTSVQAKLQESVSVKDFGAAGDGVTDDTAAIQAAIVASENVNFPKGNYLISVSLLLTANTRITADGATLIAAAGFSAGIYYFKSMITDGEDVAVENVSIDGLVFNGSSVASIVGVHTLNSANQSFTNLEMYNLSSPLLLRGDNLVPTNLLVQHCEIYDCVTGISVSGLHRDQILVKDNFVHRIDGSGIALQDSVGAEVSGNSCVRCGEVNGNGIFIKGCSDIEVINNFCSQNSILAFAGSGIGINMSGAFTNQGIVITGNVIERSGDDGIDCYTELLAVNKNIIISNNILRSNTNSGINATTDTATGGVQNDFIISNNQIYDNGFHGIGLMDCDGFVITDNMLTDNSQTTSGSYWAMYASNLESSTITGNVVKNTIASSQNGLALDGASQNCVLKDNSVESSHTQYLINSYVNNLVNLGIWTSFSPTLSIGGTASAPGDVTTSIGYYEVVDHTLNFTILLEIASAAALTGTLRIQTLPFANLSSGLGGTSAIFPCAVVGTTVGIDAYNYAYLEAGADFMFIERSDTGADLTNSIFGSGIVFRVSGQYRIS